MFVCWVVRKGAGMLSRASRHQPERFARSALWVGKASRGSKRWKQKSIQEHFKVNILRETYLERVQHQYSAPQYLSSQQQA